MAIAVDNELPIARLDALSDGVFAIAITLLALELGVEANAEQHPIHSILAEWPSYLAFVTSFLTIGVVWMAHSGITNALRAANATIYRLNLLVLLFVSFLPFPTKLVASFAHNEAATRVAVVFYGLALLALIVALTFFSRFAFEQRGLHKEHIDETTAAAAVDRRPSFLFYAVAIVIGALFPSVGRGLYLAIALYLAVPVGTIRRLARA